MVTITLEIDVSGETRKVIEKLCRSRGITLPELVKEYLCALATASTRRPGSTGAGANSSIFSEPSPRTARTYAVEVLAATDNMRMVLVHLPVNGFVPWHFHTYVHDHFFCLERPIVIEAKAPTEKIELSPGQTYIVVPGRPHRVSAADGEACKFALVQGIGKYDFRPCAS